ncbi:MAG TPA: HigA family addiction module antitoxin [Nitrospira sp.]|nr:HigA family addiction module antitoxin [Nitrospira sp.]
MAMHNPPHPGEFMIQVYLDPNSLSSRKLTGKLGVAASTLNRILTGTSRISPEMALRLSKALGRSPEGWLAMQDNFDLWLAKRHVKLGKARKVHSQWPNRRVEVNMSKRQGDGVMLEALDGVLDGWNTASPGHKRIDLNIVNHVNKRAK